MKYFRLLREKELYGNEVKVCLFIYLLVFKYLVCIIVYLGGRKDRQRIGVFSKDFRGFDGDNFWAIFNEIELDVYSLMKSELEFIYYFEISFNYKKYFVYCFILEYIEVFIIIIFFIVVEYFIIFFNQFYVDKYLGCF